MKTLKAGFTMIELLVVIAVIGILSTIGFNMFSAIDTAEQKNANDMCAQLASAWALCIDKLPPGSLDKLVKKGVNEMDTDMCAILGSQGVFDVAYLIDGEDNPDGLEKSKNSDAELKYGLLSPIGMELFKAGAPEGAIREHLYQFVLDMDNNGQVDTQDGMPAALITRGKAIAGSAAVWCWPKDESKRNQETYGKSW